MRLLMIDAVQAVRVSSSPAPSTHADPDVAARLGQDRGTARCHHSSSSWRSLAGEISESLFLRSVLIGGTFQATVSSAIQRHASRGGPSGHQAQPATLTTQQRALSERQLIDQAELACDRLIKDWTSTGPRPSFHA
jgi:hypothetical protein